MAAFCGDQRSSEFFSTSEALKTPEVVIMFCGWAIFMQSVFTHAVCTCV